MNEHVSSNRKMANGCKHKDEHEMLVPSPYGDKIISIKGTEANKASKKLEFIPLQNYLKQACSIKTHWYTEYNGAVIKTKEFYLWNNLP